MPPFLSDPGQPVYLVLTAVVVATGVLAAKNQDRRSLVRFAVALGLLLTLFLLDRVGESPREEATRRVQAMVAAANARDAAGFTEHLADTFEYRGDGGPTTVTRERVRTGGFWGILKQYDVRTAAWDFARDDVTELGPDRVEIGFLAKGEADGKPFPLYLRTTFARQPDGSMKLVALASFDPVQRRNKPVTLPYFP